MSSKTHCTRWNHSNHHQNFCLPDPSDACHNFHSFCIEDGSLPSRLVIVVLTLPFLEFLWSPPGNQPQAFYFLLQTGCVLLDRVTPLLHGICTLPALLSLLQLIPSFPTVCSLLVFLTDVGDHASSAAITRDTPGASGLLVLWWPSLSAQ